MYSGDFLAVLSRASLLNCDLAMNTSRWDVSRCTHKIDELAGVLKGCGRKRVLILCHNNPDPDSIAGAYGFQFLLNKKFGIRTVIGYGGVVTRAENQAMISRLRIKMTHFSKIDAAKYYGIALIDAQPGTTNNLIASLRESPLIVIDHHPLRKLTSKAHFRDIRPNYGATSTIITEYLVAADLTPTRSVANALLYGIKTDTNSLVRGASDADFRAFNYLFPLTNPRVLGCIEKPVLSSEYLEEYQRGLARTNIHRDVAISYLGKIHSEAIVPELADLLLRLDGISWSLCLGERGNLLIISCRSTARSYKAGNVLRRIMGDNGSAGGHRRMAGGQVPLNGLKPDDRKEIANKLITRFLRAIKREGTQPRPIFGSVEAA
jgi:nanoRNase/pAp phosphatase (c-di-AMP/oligoRNAs hydrolase)